MTKTRHRLLCGILLALLAPACAQIVGDDFDVVEHHSSGSGSGSQCDDSNFPCASCLSCAQGESCLAQTNACYQTPDCSDYEFCLQTCADACDACGTDNPAGASLYGELQACMTQACPNSCSGA